MAGFLDRLSYARSVCITVPLVFVSTALMGSVSLIGSLVDSSGRWQHACARLWALTILRICRIHLNVVGRPEFRGDRTYVFFVNHQSHVDIPVMLAVLPISFRFAAKKELFRIPFLGWHLRRSGHVRIDRYNPHAAVKAFRGASERLREGISLVFFPEGATSLDGRIKPFKGGGFLLAEQSDADVIPVTIRGSRAALLPRTYHVRGGPVEVIFGNPISSKEHGARSLMARVREEITNVFENGKALDRNTHSISR